MTTRLLIADDHRPFREGLRRLVRLLPDVECVGMAVNGHEAVQLADSLQPDVVLMDLWMPGLNGIEATRRVRETSPHIAVLVLTMLEDDESVLAAVRAGARGYLLKGAGRDELGRAVAAVRHGEAIFSPAIAQRLVQYWAAPRPVPAETPFPELTDRERDILELLGQGLGNNAIGHRLSLAPKTVRNNLSRIFAKLQVTDRAQAMILARDAGLGVDAPGRTRPP
ncbi:two component transcriptional regulator, LuxR family [Geodermatophilus dictyosporus]|uniref:Two component transcriptional regulator, LuxR family n=1 Tax=Geodermatophilus dictyosporus TaxID=1523247 RepID=A0A1I5R0P0_9ACTN|nr:response regulator transcription factor [Geodermatophilus dictyosporus]SFP52055.1 two component transcriptional regulator, LuxR family [Geodermatophilus dictyosporus]